MLPIVFSACLSENRGIRVTHRRLLRYFTVCTQPENLRAFCSVLLLTNYFFNVQQQKMLPPQIQTANQSLVMLSHTDIYIYLSVIPTYIWVFFSILWSNIFIPYTYICSIYSIMGNIQFRHMV